jgi:hypothetical protein
VELGLDQKQQLQKAVFPSGLQFDGERFGTAVTCLAFKKFGEDGSGSESASPTGPGISDRLRGLFRLAA